MSTYISVNVAGQLLNDRYKVIRALGAGGMGQTFVAEDTQRPGNPQCVVKLLKPANTDPDFLINARRLFNSEAEILEKLGNHDQIPRLLAYFEQDQEFYLVQEFIDGYPLSAELPLGQRWSEAQVIQLLQEVLVVLEFVHRHGAIHRDIKPDNIVRRQSDRKLVLIDFGAVKQVQIQRTVLGQVSLTVGIGTPGYMPTEQSKGTPRPSSDLYALGMVCIQALTGLLPTQLRENDEGEIVWQDQAEVSDDLKIILTKMVRYHFKDRYKTVLEALEAIQLLNPEISSSVPLNGNNPQRSPNPSYSPTVNNSSESSELFDPFKSAFSPVFQNEQTTPLRKPVNLPKTEFTKASTSPWWKSGWAIAGMSAVFVSVVAGAYFTHKQLQRQEQQVQLEQIKSLQAAGKYRDCANQANQFPADNLDLYTQAQDLLDKCNLAYSRQLFAQANQFAGSNRFVDAINVARKIPSDVPVYEQAQPKIGEWSEAILTAATAQYEKQGKLDIAVAWAKAIPQNSNAYQKAQDTVKTWQDEWKINEKYLSNARKALDNGQWNTVIETAQKVSTTYWKQQAKPIIDRAKDEQNLSNARQALNERRWDDAIYMADQTETEFGKDQAQSIIDTAYREKELEAQPLREEGTLSGSRYREHTFRGDEGESVTVSLESSTFDTYLTVIAPNGQTVAQDDDAGSGTNSTVTFTLSQSGTYSARVSSYDSRRGSYVLTVSRNR